MGGVLEGYAVRMTHLAKDISNEGYAVRMTHFTKEHAVAFSRPHASTLSARLHRIAFTKAFPCCATIALALRFWFKAKPFRPD